MAHVLEKGQYFLFRTKDIHSKGLIGNFTLPQEDSFDIWVNVTLVRSHKKSIVIQDGFYKRYVDRNTTFDYITHGSLDTYRLSFRIVRFPISENTYECDCYESSGRGISIRTDKTNLFFKMVYRGFFSKTEIYDWTQQLSCLQTGIYQTRNLGKADCL